jgi:hypothetical protein
MERTTDDFRDHDCLGIADRAHRPRAYPSQLYFARFVLGAAEAGFFPGVIV